LRTAVAAALVEAGGGRKVVRRRLDRVEPHVGRQVGEGEQVHRAIRAFEQVPVGIGRERELEVTRPGAADRLDGGGASGKRACGGGGEKLATGRRHAASCFGSG
jgi:hypothetical protein